jgi:hypothetical protein
MIEPKAPVSRDLLVLTVTVDGAELNVPGFSAKKFATSKSGDLMVEL